MKVQVSIEVKAGEGMIHLYNVYSVPVRININPVPSPMAHSTVYMGDSNALYPASGGRS